MIAGCQAIALSDSLRQFAGERLRRFLVSGHLLGIGLPASGPFLHSAGADFLVGYVKKNKAFGSQGCRTSKQVRCNGWKVAPRVVRAGVPLRVQVML